MTPGENSAAQVLEGCPFCGSRTTMFRGSGGEDYAAFCSSCDVRGRWFNTEAEAIAAWNRRVPVSTPASTGEGEVERVAKELYADLWNREVAVPPGFEVTPEMAPDFPYLYREPARMGARRAIAAVAALPPSSGCATSTIDKQACVSECAGSDRQSGWEAGAEAMREAVAEAVDVDPSSHGEYKLNCRLHSSVWSALARSIRALPLPPPPSREGVE